MNMVKMVAAIQKRAEAARQAELRGWTPRKRRRNGYVGTKIVHVPYDPDTTDTADDLDKRHKFQRADQ